MLVIMSFEASSVFSLPMLLLSSYGPPGAALLSFGIVASSNGTRLCLLWHYTVTFSEDRDERKRVLAGSCRFATILLEKILKLH